MLENIRGHSRGSIPPLRMPSPLPHDLCHEWNVSRRLPAVVLLALCAQSENMEETPIGPIAVGHSRSEAQPCRPARHPVRSAASPACSGELTSAGGSLADASRRSPRTPSPPATGVSPSRTPNPWVGRRRVGSARFPTTCAVAWVHVFRLLAPAEPEHLGGSVNETC